MTTPADVEEITNLLWELVKAVYRPIVEVLLDVYRPFAKLHEELQQFHRLLVLLPDPPKPEET